MTQRNPLNDRYNSSSDDKRTGKTRKSSASAKPKTQRAATVRDPAPKTAKQKKEEARERERKAAQKTNVMQARFEDTATYKRLRRYWWAALGGAIACTAISFALQQSMGMTGVAMAAMIIAYTLIILAFWIDLGKIRKERKIYGASMLNDKSKSARKEQKKLRAELREQEKEAAEKYEAAKAEEAEKAAKRKGLFGLFGKGKGKEDSDQKAAASGPEISPSKKRDMEGPEIK